MPTTDLLTAADVSERLGVDRSTVYRMAADGRLGAVKVGTQWRFPPVSLETVLAEGVEGHTAPRGAPVVPLRVAREAVLRTVAPILDVMLVVTDMEGRLVTEVLNPCMWFREHRDDPALLESCTTQWQRMAGDVELTPRLEVGEHGFACARSFVRDGDKLVGLVVAGGIAADPHDRQEATASGLHFLDERGRARLLGELPRVAAAISDLTTPRPTLDPRSAR